MLSFNIRTLWYITQCRHLMFCDWTSKQWVWLKQFEATRMNARSQSINQVCNPLLNYLPENVIESSAKDVKKLKYLHTFLLDLTYKVLQLCILHSYKYAPIHRRQSCVTLFHKTLVKSTHVQFWVSTYLDSSDLISSKMVYFLCPYDIQKWVCSSLNFGHL